MREDWVETTLGEVAQVNPESVTALSGETLIDYVDLSAVSEHSGITISELRIKYRDAPGRARRVIHANNVLVSTVRPYLRGFAIVPPTLDGAIASTGFAVLEAKPSKALPRFLWAVVRERGFVDYLMSRATGSNYPAVRSKDVADTPILLPPLHEQHRIVDLVSSVDDYIESLQRKVDATRTARNAVLEDLLTAGGGDWVETTLGEVADFVPGKYLPKEAYVESGEYFIYGSNSVMGRYDQALVNGPHTVMAAVGAYAGAIRFSDGPSWINNNAFGIVAHRRVLPAMLHHLLGAFLQANQVTAGTGQPYVRRPVLKSARLSIPPLHEQHRIVEIVSSLDDATSAAEGALNNAKELRKGLLSELLSGEHRIPETYDELLKTA